ncbi:hypothetical protein AB9F46_35440, partial [Rhizobium leguminosarum]
VDDDQSQCDKDECARHGLVSHQYWSPHLKRRERTGHHLGNACPTLLFICVGYADYMLERRRHMVAVKHAVRRRSDEF